jgi:hypothetical protein
LAPSFFLHTDGEGLLYEIKLDFNKLLRGIPSTECIVPILLQRNEPRQTMLTYIMGRLDVLVENYDLTTIKVWLGVIVHDYSKSEAAMKWDKDSTDETLLSASSLLELDTLSILNEISVPSSCQTVLTQSEVLQYVLLKHTKLALEESNDRYLELVCSISIHYLIEIEMKTCNPCFALQCLVIALLVKQCRVSELTSYLSTRETQWIQVRRRRQMNLTATSGTYFDYPGVAIAFAEILFKIGKLPLQLLLTHHSKSIFEQLKL